MKKNIKPAAAAGNGKAETVDACPLGGDIADDCEGCAYCTDYHYDHETGDCVRREQPEG